MAQKRNNMYKIIETYPEVGPLLCELEPSLKEWIIEILEYSRIMELNDKTSNDKISSLKHEVKP